MKKIVICCLLLFCVVGYGHTFGRKNCCNPCCTEEVVPVKPEIKEVVEETKEEVVLPKKCDTDTFECADGTTLTRNIDNDCEFDACPQRRVVEQEPEPVQRPATKYYPALW